MLLVGSREGEREARLLVNAESDTAQTGRHFVRSSICMCMCETYTWQLLDMNISFIGFILLYSFPDLFWVLHVYLMPERFEGQMGFGNTGANASKMRM